MGATETVCVTRRRSSESPQSPGGPGEEPQTCPPAEEPGEGAEGWGWSAEGPERAAEDWDTDTSGD